MEVFYSKQKHHLMNCFNIFTPFEVDRAGVTVCLKFISKRGTLAKSKTDLFFPSHFFTFTKFRLISLVLDVPDRHLTCLMSGG